MKSKKVRAGTIGAVIFAIVALPPLLTAQNTRYKLIDLGTFGGPNSFGGQNGFFVGPNPLAQVVNDRGVAVGTADLPISDPFCILDCFVAHAFKWQNGILTDIGVLPGGSISGAGWISANGLTVGGSENGVMDPLTGFPEFRAVAWTKSGQIIDLGTLPGGTGSFAAGVNSSDQIAGGGTNDIADPFSPVGKQFRALLWDKGVVHDLGTLGGDDAFAAYINDRGQVAGFSFTSSTPNPSSGIPTVHPFLWQNGKMRDLGSLGGLGTPGNFNQDLSVEVNALNSRGEVAGTSPLAGDQTHHAFLWDGTLKDLGTLGGANSQAFWVSNSGLVVGRADFSPESPNHHAFLWKDGVMHDLGTLGPCLNSTAVAVNANGQAVGDTGDCPGGGGGPSFFSEDGQPMVDINTLVLPGSDIEVVDVSYINDRGEIAGGGILPNGDFHAVLLIPASAEEIAAADSSGLSQPTHTAMHRFVKDADSLVPSRRNGTLNMFRQTRLP